MFKKVSTIVIFSLIIAGCGVQNQRVYPYPFDTAHVEFSIKGAMNGKSTLYIKGDNYFQEFIGIEKEEGKDKEVHNIIIERDGLVYQIDMNKKTGQKIEDPTYKIMKETEQSKKMQKLIDIQVGVNEEKSSKSVTTKVTKEGTKEVAGKTCELYKTAFSEAGETEMCLWGGIPLYTVLNIPSVSIKNVSEASLVETNIPVDDKRFEVPKDITFQE